MQTGRFRSLQRLLPDLNISFSVHLRPYVRIIAISAFSLAIGIGIALRYHLNFEFHDSSGVVGWISVNEYPKHQEYFYYLLALIGIPATIYIYWFVWHSYSQWAAQVTNQSINRVLKLNALASIPLCLCWFQFSIYGQAGFLGLAIPVGITFIFLTILFLFKYQFLAKKLDKISSDPITQNLSNTSNISDTRLILRRTFEYIIVPIFIYLLIFNSNVNGNIDMFHEGERLAPLNEMIHGGVVFQDIYVQHGLFQNAYLAWFGSKIFEPTLMGVRFMERMLYPLGFIALYLLGLQIFRGRFLTAFICFLIVSGDNFSISPRHCFGLLSFVCVANYLTYNKDRGLFVSWQRTPFDQRKWIRHIFKYGWKLILAGFFTSIAFWYSTEVGLYTLGAIGLFLLIYSLKRRIQIEIRPFPLVSYCGGILLGFLPVAIYFLSHGALDDLFWNSYIQCKYQLATWGLKYPSLSNTLDIITVDGWRTFFLSNGFRWYLPILIYMIFAGYLIHLRLCRTNISTEDSLKLLLILLGGIVFFRTALGRSDGGHLHFGSTFLWLLCIFPLDRGISNLLHILFGGEAANGVRERLSQLKDTSRWKQAAKAIWILIPLVMCIWYVGEIHNPLKGLYNKWNVLRVNQFRYRDIPVELDRAGKVDIPDDQAAQIQEVVAYIQQNTETGEKIFDFTSQGAYFFFANRPSVTRFHMVCYASTPGMQREVISDLENDQTRLVIFKTGGWFDRIDGIPVEERHPLIAEYLAQNYDLAININNTEILLRK